jgi:3-oxoadipate enol-lactonase
MKTEFIALGALRIAAVVSGRGPWVVLAHALGADHRMWVPQIEALASHFTVLAYDMRGHGRSSVPPGPYSIAQLAGDAHRMLQQLGVERAHWVGLSLGGMVGQALALQHPESVDRLVIANSYARTAPPARQMWAERAATARAKGMEALVDGTLARWFTPAFADRAPEAIDRIRAIIAATHPEGYAACCEAIMALDHLDGLRTLTHRALIVAGAQDQAAPPALSQEIVHAWPGAELLVIEDAAHLSNLEQPQAFNDAVRRFLA